MRNSMKNNATAKPPESLASLLYGVGRLLREKISRNHKDPATFIQMKILAVINEGKDPTMKDIADCLYVASPTATVMISRLVEQGHVERSPDPKDRRIVRLAITAKGRKTLERGTREIDAAMSSITSSLRKADSEKLRSLLTKIISANQH